MRWNKLILILIIVLVNAVCGLAQTISSAKLLMNQGKYADAVVQLEALQIIYPGYYESDLNIAKKCLALQKEAIYKVSINSFTEAIKRYESIRVLNPNDVEASKQIEYYKTKRINFLDRKLNECKTEQEYKNFIRQYPNTEQAVRARKCINELNTKYKNEQNPEYRDKLAWEAACRTNTLESYTTYLRNAPITSKYLGVCYLQCARLFYSQNRYSSAKESYDKALNKGEHLLWNDINYYGECLFQLLGNAPESWSLDAVEKWLDDNNLLSKYEKQINTYRLQNFIKLGIFSSAEYLVERVYPNFDPSMILNKSAYWTKKDWLDYVKSTKKNYNKKQKQSSTNTYKPKKSYGNIGFMAGIGATFGAYIEPGEITTVIGPQIAVSIGDIFNIFNFEVSAEYLFNGNGEEMLNIKLAPRFNLFAGYLSLQPEVHYDVLNKGLYKFSYAASVSYNTDSFGTFSFSPTSSGYFNEMLWKFSYTYYFGTHR